MFKLNNITKTYQDSNNKIEALKGVNIEFEDNGLYFILGPSGSGKSTLLNLLGGLDTPTSGELYIAGVNTKDFTETQWDDYRNHHLGFVFQSFNLLNNLTVLENVELKLHAVNKYTSLEITQKSIELLNKVGLQDHIYKRPTQLSGGQQQRVAIARALVSNPKVLLCDEPTGALDNNTSEEIMELLQEISKDTLIITVTHDIKLTERYDSNVFVVERGTTPDVKVLEEISTELPISNSQISMSGALKLSYKNILTSLKRSLIVILACALSVTTVLTIFSVSTGLEYELVELGLEKMSKYPVSAYRYGYLSDEEVEALTSIDESLYDFMTYSTRSNLYTVSDDYEYASKRARILPQNYQELDKQYNVLAGSLELEENEIVLILDKYNQLGDAIDYLSHLGSGLQAEDYIGVEILRTPLDCRFVWNGTTMDRVDAELCYDDTDILKIGAVLSPLDLYPANDLVSVSNILGSGIFITQEIHNNILEESANSEYAYYYNLYPEINIHTGKVWEDNDRERATYSRSIEPSYSRIAYVPSTSETKVELLEQLNIIVGDTLRISDPASETIEFTISLTDLLLLVVLVIAIISILVAATLIFILTYANILQRRKEVGILRGLGITKSKTISIFVQETLIIGLIATLISFLLYFIIRIPLNKLAYEYFGYREIVKVSLLNLILLPLICNLFFVLSSFFPVRKGVNINISDIIRY